jgi:hypothetical protein
MSTLKTMSNHFQHGEDHRRIKTILCELHVPRVKPYYKILCHLNISNLLKILILQFFYWIMQLFRQYGIVCFPFYGNSFLHYYIYCNNLHRYLLQFSFSFFFLYPSIITFMTINISSCHGKIVDRGQIDTPSIQIHLHSHSRPGTAI